MKASASNRTIVTTAPDIDRLGLTKSRFAASINDVLQHNRPDSGHAARPLKMSAKCHLRTLSASLDDNSEVKFQPA